MIDSGKSQSEVGNHDDNYPSSIDLIFYYFDNKIISV